MKIAIFSDSHDNTENILKLISKLNKIKVDYALHCGDICSPFSIKLFEKLNVKNFFVVFGNNDGDKVNLIKNMPKNTKFFQNYGEITLSNKKILFTHYDFIAKAFGFLNKYDYIFFGHTHKKEILKIKKTILINPGEILGYFSKPSFCILDLKNEKYKFYNL